MLISITFFAGLVSVLVLAAVYLADRFEREPVELIQNCYLLGFAVQLVLLIGASAFLGPLLWQGWWRLATLGCAAILVPLFVRDLREMDERFDGIVYFVVFLAGSICVVHLNNLPQLAAISPYRDALRAGASPDLRDLTIVYSSPALTHELGQTIAILVIGVLAGALLGVLHRLGWSVWRTVAACSVLGAVCVGLATVAGDSLWVRGLLLVTAVASAWVLKLRSVHRKAPEPAERDVLVMATKTVLMLLGAALMASAVLSSLAPIGDQEPPLTDGAGEHEVPGESRGRGRR